MNALQQFLQAASNEAAGAVSGPVDLIGMGLRKLGVPVPRNALMSSEWMKQNGLMQDVPQSGASLAGQTFGLLSPIAAAAKAPQIARGLLQMGDNAAAPVARGKMGQMGAVVYHGSPRGPIIGAPRVGPHDETGINGFSVSPSKPYAKSYADDVMGRHWDVTDPNPTVTAFDLDGQVMEYGKFMEMARKKLKTEMPSHEKLMEFARANKIVGVDHSENLGIPEISVFFPEALKRIEP